MTFSSLKPFRDSFCLGHEAYSLQQAWSNSCSLLGFVALCSPLCSLHSRQSQIMDIQCFLLWTLKLFFFFFLLCYISGEVGHPCHSHSNLPLPWAPRWLDIALLNLKFGNFCSSQNFYIHFYYLKYCMQMLFTLIPGFCGKPVCGPKEREALQPLPRAHTPALSPRPAPTERHPSSSVSRSVWSHWPLGEGTWVLSQWHDKHNSHVYNICHELASKYVDSSASKQLIKVDPQWMVKPWETQRLSDLLNHTAFRLKHQNSYL